MTVKELIEQLLKYPPETEIIIPRKFIILNEEEM